MKETELYAPVKALFEGLGYDVKGEVAHVDVVAIKEEEFILIELKTSFSLKLLLQATQRQKLGQNVYVALPAPKARRRYSKGFKEYEHILRRLELGLILVHFDKEPIQAEIVFEPKIYERRLILNRHARQRRELLKEAEGRLKDYNVGGGNAQLITVYKQNALLIAAFMDPEEPMRAYKLRDLSGIKNADRILRSNHYSWFEKVGRGIYILSQTFAEEAEEFQDLIAELKALRLKQLQALEEEN